MNIELPPTVGNWYVTAVGKLIKIKMNIQENGSITKVLVEYLNGDTKIVSRSGWDELNITKAVGMAGSRVSIIR